MSKLRVTYPTTRGEYAPQGTTAYLVIYEAVKTQPGLIHGTLHAQGAHCAIGSYFHLHPDHALNEAMIDEIAAVNDAVPTKTPKQRRAFVLRWLRWKLAQAGMPGFRKAAAGVAPKP